MYTLEVKETTLKMIAFPQFGDDEKIPKPSTKIVDLVKLPILLRVNLGRE